MTRPPDLSVTCCRDDLSIDPDLESHTREGLLGSPIHDTKEHRPDLADSRRFLLRLGPRLVRA